MTFNFFKDHIEKLGVDCYYPLSINTLANWNRICLYCSNLVYSAFTWRSLGAPNKEEDRENPRAESSKSVTIYITALQGKLSIWLQF